MINLELQSFFKVEVKIEKSDIRFKMIKKTPGKGFTAKHNLTSAWAELVYEKRGSESQ